MDVTWTRQGYRYVMPDMTLSDQQLCFARYFPWFLCFFLLLSCVTHRAAAKKELIVISACVSPHQMMIANKCFHADRGRPQKFHLLYKSVHWGKKQVCIVAFEFHTVIQQMLVNPTHSELC